MLNAYLEEVPNKNPIANAGDDVSVDYGNLVNFDASSSFDSDGNIVSYLWREGTSVLSTNESFNKLNLSTGYHTINLTVTDDDGAIDNDSMQIYVRDIEDAHEVSALLLDTQPYSNIGIIQVVFPDGTSARGTASIVGENDILTATHVVYSPDNGGWADSYEFYFGADYNDTTDTFEDYGYHYTPTQWLVNGWPDSAFTDSDNSTMIYSEVEYDIAVIGVNDSIGIQLGHLGLAAGYNSGSILANAVGYPVGATGMLEQFVEVEKNSFYDLYNSSDKVFDSGSSGGPLLIDNNIIGVKSTGYSWADVGGVWEKLMDSMDDNNYLIA